MSTWHQRQNPTPLWHPTKWTAVSDPHEGTLTSTLFDTYEHAYDYVIKADEVHTYLIPPFNKQRIPT